MAFDNAARYCDDRAIVARVYLTAPPDFRYKSNIDRFFRFVRDLENVDDGSTLPNHTAKSDTTDIWLRPYTEFLQFISPVDPTDQNDFQSNFYDYLPSFLGSADYERFSNDLRFKSDTNGETKLDKFKFTISYFRTPFNLYNYEDHVRILLKWRWICRNYSEYNAIVLDAGEMNAFLDQRLTLAPVCLQYMGIALLSVSIVTVFLMPDIRSMFFIRLSFLSVDIGIIGGMKLWRCDLDNTTVSFVLMIIGFSVYYTARVCYCYQMAPDTRNSHEKMQRTMGTVGWPILQGALATGISILPCIAIKCYIIRVFYKTISLLVLIGLLHGLLIIPVLMCTFDQSARPAQKYRQRSNGN